MATLIKHHRAPQKFLLVKALSMPRLRQVIHREQQGEIDKQKRELSDHIEHAREQLRMFYENFSALAQTIVHEAHRRENWRIVEHVLTTISFYKKNCADESAAIFNLAQGIAQQITHENLIERSHNERDYAVEEQLAQTITAEFLVPSNYYASIVMSWPAAACEHMPWLTIKKTKKTDAELSVRIMDTCMNLPVDVRDIVAIVMRYAKNLHHEGFTKARTAGV